jgi:tRNA-2-methylthio-N6-dimethylallyladenosine synthase
MVGFPGETEEDYNDTLSAMREVRFLESFMYYYNPREGTAAVDFINQIEASVKMRRLQSLINLQRQITHEEKIKRSHAFPVLNTMKWLCSPRCRILKLEMW